MAAKPHIVFIYADQHRWDCVGINGHPLLRTPNLDRIAREGANFRHAYTPSPICVPARCSLLTGKWPTQHGTVCNFDGETFVPFDPMSPNPIRSVTGAGWHSMHLGRWHIAPGSDATAYGFHRFIPDWRYGQWRRRRGLPPMPHADWRGGVDAGVTPEEGPLGWSSRMAVRLIEEALEGVDPILLHWHFVEPHIPCVPPEPFASMFDPATIPEWPGFRDTLAGKPWIQAHMRRGWGVEGLTWRDWAPVVARYLGTVAYIDQQVGVVLDALDRLGIAEDTLVVYTADHGDMGGSHGMVDKHYIMYDDVTRVPFLMRWPRRIRPGTVVDAMVSNAIDFAATTCDIAGVPAPAEAGGMSLLPLCDAQPGRSAIGSQWAGNQFGSYTQRMWRERRWKYVFNATDVDELYDLEADPGELTNRAGDPACRGELIRLRQGMRAWMQAIKDPMVVGLARSMEK